VAPLLGVLSPRLGPDHDAVATVARVDLFLGQDGFLVISRPLTSRLDVSSLIRGAATGSASRQGRIRPRLPRSIGSGASAAPRRRPFMSVREKGRVKTQGVQRSSIDGRSPGQAITPRQPPAIQPATQLCCSRCCEAIESLRVSHWQRPTHRRGPATNGPALALGLHGGVDGGSGAIGARRWWCLETAQSLAEPNMLPRGRPTAPLLAAHMNPIVKL
jgi:hypothetical protein